MLAACFALTAFAAAVAVGAYVGNDPVTVIGRGIAIMLGCYLVGLLVGSAAQRTIDEHTRRHEQDHPVPQTVDDLPDDLTSPAAPQAPTS